MEKVDLIELLNRIFVPLGFKRKGNNWVHNGEELKKIVNLQKSNFSNRYYINYGFVIQKLELKGLYMHVSYRLGHLDSNINRRISTLLDLENPMDSQIGIAELSDILIDAVVNKFATTNNESELEIEVKKMPYSSMIPLIVKQFYNLGDW